MYRFLALFLIAFALVANSGACAQGENLDPGQFGGGLTEVTVGTTTTGMGGATGTSSSTTTTTSGPTTGSSTTSSTATTTTSTTSTTTAGGSSTSGGGSGGLGTGGSPAGTGGLGGGGSGMGGGGRAGTGGGGAGGASGSGGSGTGGAGGGGSCSPTVTSNTLAKCNSTINYNSKLYKCISQASGVNGEPTGCGTNGVYCSTITPTDPAWGTTAWQFIQNCP